MSHNHIYKRKFPHNMNMERSSLVGAVLMLVQVTLGVVASPTLRPGAGKLLSFWIIGPLVQLQSIGIPTGIPTLVALKLS